VIRSDLTVMKHKSLTIEAGVELQFYPSVGILVLGSLVVAGTPNNRVRFGPIDSAEYRANRGRRSAVPVQSIDRIHHPDVDARRGYEIRFVGGPNDDEGFIQIYNRTERRWAIICDTSFNERTAEVACRTAGRESSNAIVRRSPYYDMFVLGYPLMHEQVTTRLLCRCIMILVLSISPSVTSTSPKLTASLILQILFWDTHSNLRRLT